MRFLFLSMLFMLLLWSCKTNEDDPAQTEEWDMEINVNLTEPPPPSPFDITGVAEVEIDDEQVTFTGTYDVGNLTYENVVFHGTVNGNQLTLTTTEYQVTYEFQGTTYTEDISWVLPAFPVSANSATGSGTIVAVKTPGNITESGTFSFTATKK